MIVRPFMSEYAVGGAPAGSVSISSSSAACSRLATMPASAAPGQLVSFSVTTKNAGKNPTGPTVTKVFYSTDGKLGAGDVELATRNVPGLGVNTTDVWAVAATIPAGAPAGTRYFFAVADYLGAQVESKETNNTKKKAFIVTP